MGEPASNREWRYWGRHDPLFGVASLPGRQIGGPAAWTPAELIESGRRYFADVFRQWQQYGVTTHSCVEIGCGSGRITRQLLTKFPRVTGLDVSPEQLATARTLVGEPERLDLVLVTEPVMPVADGSCTAVFSCEVFQHFESDAPFEAYLAESFRVLAPGGTMAFHVPLRGIHPKSVLASPLRNALLGVLRMLGRRRMMIYRQYDVRRVTARLASCGFVDVELRCFHAAGHGRASDFDAYFFARKPARLDRPVFTSA